MLAANAAISVHASWVGSVDASGWCGSGRTPRSTPTARPRPAARAGTSPPIARPASMPTRSNRQPCGMKTPNRIVMRTTYGGPTGRPISGRRRPVRSGPSAQVRAPAEDDMINTSDRFGIRSQEMTIHGHLQPRGPTFGPEEPRPRPSRSPPPAASPSPRCGCPSDSSSCGPSWTSCSGSATRPRRAKSWINGGSPTKGFLSGVEVGPFQSSFNSIAGTWWADTLFMLGLLAIGVALILGVGAEVRRRSPAR